MKRALLYSTVVLLIITLFGFVGLAIIVAQADAGIKATKDIDLCRLSVLKASTIKNIVPGGSTSIASVKVDCPRIETKVSKKDVTKDGKVSEELIKKAMADELKNCWYKMGKGSAGAFNQNIIQNPINAVFDSENDYVCLVCSSIVFDQEVLDALKKDGGKEKVGDFMRYLDETPHAPSGSDTYLDYLTLDKEYTRRVTLFYYTTLSGNDALSAMDEIDIGKTYQIFYVVYKGDYMSTKIAEVNAWLSDQIGFSGLLELKKNDAYGSIFVADEDHVRDVKCAGGLLN